MHQDRVSFVITVEPVSEPTICAAVHAINTFEFMVEPVLLLHVESSLSRRTYIASTASRTSSRPFFYRQRFACTRLALRHVLKCGPQTGLSRH